MCSKHFSVIEEKAVRWSYVGGLKTGEGLLVIKVEGSSVTHVSLRNYKGRTWAGVIWCLDIFTFVVREKG